MAPAVDLVTLSGVVALGLVHGAEPGHGWPIAATYALDTSRKWFFGLVAGLVIGIGHLISSLAVVGVFFLAKSYFGISQFPWLNEAAGILLVLLGIHEYRHGHSHSHSDGHDDGHEHDHEGQGHDGHVHADNTHDGSHGKHGGHGHEPIPGIRDGGLQALDHDHDESHDPAHDHKNGHKQTHDHGHGHTHDHGNLEEAADRGLWSLASAAFVLGFAHEEEFEIIGICAGTDACLSLMLVYALAVIVSLVGLTLLLVAGYHRYQDRVERIAPHFSTISAVVLIGMGVLFIVGVL